MHIHWKFRQRESKLPHDAALKLLPSSKRTFSFDYEVVGIELVCSVPRASEWVCKPLHVIYAMLRRFETRPWYKIWHPSLIIIFPETNPLSSVLLPLLSEPEVIKNLILDPTIPWRNPEIVELSVCNHEDEQVTKPEENVEGCRCKVKQDVILCPGHCFMSCVPSLTHQLTSIKEGSACLQLDWLA